MLGRIGNFFVALLLRSPAHGLMSGAFMLITVTGRRTGRSYTTPVNFAREGNVLTVVSRRGRTWWRNLEDSAPVTCRLAGRDVPGTGRVLALEGEAMAAELGEFFRKLGHAQSPEKIAARAPETVIIRVELEEKG